MPRVRNPIDSHVGSRLRLRRTLAGMSQTELGTKIGLTFQQIQKYEKGANRIGAGRLFQFAEILGVPPSFFFDGLPSQESTNLAADQSQNTMLSREAMELLRAYNGIPNDLVRRRILALVKSMSADPGVKEEEAETSSAISD